jgi:protein tyrosine/serine phosphatase
MGMYYSDCSDEKPTKNKDVNFREIHMGSIAPGILYRSSHPIPNGEKNNEVIKLVKKVQIACVINLADSLKVLHKSVLVCEWYRRMLISGRAIALDMDFDFASNSFAGKLGCGILFLISHDGPDLIHCFAGFDRTGFMSILLEALMGAPLNAITNDYLLSYGKGFYSAINDSENEDARVVIEQLKIINLGEPVMEKNLQTAAERYLKEKAGLSEDEIKVLKGKLSTAPVII